jgi:hypothetical protein
MTSRKTFSNNPNNKWEYSRVKKWLKNYCARNLRVTAKNVIKKSLEGII